MGKPLRVNYAKKQSDVIAKMRGTYEESDKAKREQRRTKEISKNFVYLTICVGRGEVDKAKEEAN
jgi:hypothetical protein